MNTYHKSDLSFWIDWYSDCYATGTFNFRYLKDKLTLLESTESEWANHTNHSSYYASVEALKIVIDKINKKEINKQVREPST